MPKRKPPKPPPIVLINDKPVVVEGFAANRPSMDLHSAPSFWNALSLRKFRVTVELVDEPRQVLIERLRLLWRNDTNQHHTQAFHQAAEELGIVLDNLEYGIDAKEKRT